MTQKIWGTHWMLYANVYMAYKNNITMNQFFMTTNKVGLMFIDTVGVSKHDEAETGSLDSLYIKLKLNRDCTSIILASFHR